MNAQKYGYLFVTEAKDESTEVETKDTKENKSKKKIKWPLIIGISGGAAILITTALVLVFTLPHSTDSTSTSDDSAYSYSNSTRYFGNYPQTKVADSSTISSLTSKAGTLPTSANSRSWTPYKWYISSSSATNFAWYIDLDTNSDGQNDYRGVYFTSYRPYFTNASSSASNSFQDDNGYSTSTVYWFKYEAIEWRILQNNNGNYFIMSNKIIDSEQYSISTSISSKTDYNGNTASVYLNNYQYSDLRTFLNVDFYNSAFSSSEKNSIKTTVVDNSASSTGYSSNSYACSDTNDKVFVLSYSEVTNSIYGFISSYDRNLKVTDYAACMGCYVNGDYGDCGYWWLRSPNCGYSHYAECVCDVGNCSDYNIVYYTNYGVVPALHLQKQW